MGASKLEVCSTNAVACLGICSKGDVLELEILEHLGTENLLEDRELGLWGNRHAIHKHKVVQAIIKHGAFIREQSMQDEVERDRERGGRRKRQEGAEKMNTMRRKGRKGNIDWRRETGEEESAR